MEKVIVEYDNGVVSTYDVVTFRSYKKGKKEVKEMVLLQLIFQKTKMKTFLCQ